MNPYEVLGVSPNDDEETIKKAYRTLVKKYHPDRYANSPLAEQANEKLKQINLAYDMICGKAQPQQPGGTQGGYSPGGRYSGAASFESVRVLISMMQTDAAEAMLDTLPRTAEWYYLKGVICTRRGFYTNARRYFETACRLDPGNAEYQSALAGFARSASDYKSFSTNIPSPVCCAASLCCSSLLCRNCFCFC